MRRYSEIGMVALLCVFATGIISGCSKTLIPKPDQDPVAIFEETWKTMDQNYALFGVKQVNWDSIHTVYATKITSRTDSHDLFEQLASMLSSLKDGHVVLSRDSTLRGYTGFYTNYAANFNFDNIQHSYLSAGYSVQGPIIYAIYNNVAYLRIINFTENISPSALDSIIDYIQPTRGLILDVRNNAGGDLKNVNTVFSRLIASAVLVKYEQGKSGTRHTDFAAPIPTVINPEGTYYKGPIRLLTNRACFSACNDFVLYMSLRPIVQSFGDQTGGGGGIPFDYFLGNGWKLQYTGTVTLSPSKVPIEAGILPNHKIDISSFDEFNRRDPILEAAFASLP